MHYYPFKVNLDVCDGSCNAFDDPSCRIYSRQSRDVRWNVFDMITEINESKALTRHIM